VVGEGAGGVVCVLCVRVCACVFVCVNVCVYVCVYVCLPKTMANLADCKFLQSGLCIHFA